MKWTWAFFLPLIAACAPSTGSKRFSFDAAAGGIARDNDGAFTFTNERGWAITLTRAKITLGPVYLNVVRPLTDPAQSLVDWLVPSAYAAGEADLSSGRVVGEVLGQVEVDALSPALVPFPVRGTMTQDDVRTADIGLFPEPFTSPDTNQTRVVTADVAGSATRGGLTIRFRGQLVLNDAWLPDLPPGARGSVSIRALRQVRGVPASFFADEGGSLEIRIDARSLFRGADFANLENNPVDADGTKVLVQSKSGKTSTDQVMTNIFNGIRSVERTYAVRWITQ